MVTVVFDQYIHDELSRSKSRWPLIVWIPFRMHLCAGKT